VGAAVWYSSLAHASSARHVAPSRASENKAPATHAAHSRLALADPARD
jgi:hypothetical protein